MDLMNVILPGAESLVTAILADGWAQVRAVLARRWSRRTNEPQDEVERRLDTSYNESVELVGQGDDQRALLEAHWAGFLATVLAEHAVLLDFVRELSTEQLGSRSGASVQNTNSGTVTTLVQSGDIHGSITFGTQA
jgi:hypothetical protein